MNVSCCSSDTKPAEAQGPEIPAPYQQGTLTPGCEWPTEVLAWDPGLRRRDLSSTLCAPSFILSSVYTLLLMTRTRTATCQCRIGGSEGLRSIPSWQKVVRGRAWLAGYSPTHLPVITWYLLRTCCVLGTVQVLGRPCRGTEMCLLPWVPTRAACCFVREGAVRPNNRWLGIGHRVS